MSRDDASLLDIVRAGQLILQFAQEFNRNQLNLDLRTQSTILYQIGMLTTLLVETAQPTRQRSPLQLD